MVVGILVILILDLVVFYGLYVFFVDDNRKFFLVIGIFRLVYILIFGVVIFYLI